MKKIFFVQVLTCALSCAGALYSYVRQQNDLTKIRIELPRLAREVRSLEEHNSRLKYEIERFENPKHLMQLAKRPEYSHLKYPLTSEIFVFHAKDDVVYKETESLNEFEPKTRSIFIGSTIIESK
jgi:hypothetical protein